VSPREAVGTAHLLGAPVTVEEDGGRALVHLMACIPPSVVHFQQPIFIGQLLSKETCLRRSTSLKIQFDKSQAAAPTLRWVTLNIQGAKKADVAYWHGATRS
jgi:hypothetical protein